MACCSGSGWSAVVRVGVIGTVVLKDDEGRWVKLLTSPIERSGRGEDVFDAKLTVLRVFMACSRVLLGSESNRIHRMCAHVSTYEPLCSLA